MHDVPAQGVHKKIERVDLSANFEGTRIVPRRRQQAYLLDAAKDPRLAVLITVGTDTKVHLLLSLYHQE